MDETKGNEGTATGAGAPSVSLEMTPVATAAPPERAAVPREKDYDWGRTLGEGTFGTVRAPPTSPLKKPLARDVQCAVHC
jgi:hypothetical protein